MMVVSPTNSHHVLKNKHTLHLNKCKSCDSLVYKPCANIDATGAPNMPMEMTDMITTILWNSMSMKLECTRKSSSGTPIRRKLLEPISLNRIQAP